MSTNSPLHCSEAQDNTKARQSLLGKRGRHGPGPARPRGLVISQESGPQAIEEGSLDHH